MNPQVCGVETVTASGNFKDPGAVQRVLSGEETVANAAWWGFDAADSTEAIQGAISSGAKKVVIPYVGKEWVVRPIKLAGNQEVVFEPGVVVIAKKGEFKGKRDCLFSASGLSNITLRGYGATLRMRKSDYASFKYTKAEWRHTVAFLVCSNVNVLGLRLESSGGDGIYIGSTEGKRRLPCKSVLIRDCICDNNYRQGISVTSADELLIENCTLKNTKGTPPKAGILFEPNHSTCVIANCVISNCVSENNAGAGLRVQLKRLKAPKKVSILFVNCYVKGGGTGLQVGPITDNGPKGLIEFRNCVVENSRFPGIYVYDKSVNGALVRFKNCSIRGTGTDRPFPKVPIHMISTEQQLTRHPGGIEFVNCYVYDDIARPFLTVAETKGVQGFSQIKGNITVFNPHGAQKHLGSKTKKLALKVKSFGTRK
jgi:parallel beta-helix repeat protein